jgi:hypothetical protein
VTVSIRSDDYSPVSLVGSSMNPDHVSNLGRRVHFVSSLTYAISLSSNTKRLSIENTSGSHKVWFSGILVPLSINPRSHNFEKMGPRLVQNDWLDNERPEPCSRKVMMGMVDRRQSIAYQERLNIIRHLSILLNYRLHSMDSMFQFTNNLDVIIRHSFETNGCSK